MLPKSSSFNETKLKPLANYFRNNLEDELITSIKSICKVVVPDIIFAELATCYRHDNSVDGAKGHFSYTPPIFEKMPL